MGWFDSSEESKVVDTNGNVNNNVVVQIQEEVDTFGKEIIVMLGIITIILIIQFINFCYKVFVNKIKKNYEPNRV